jgi:hypothetical protein
MQSLHHLSSLRTAATPHARPRSGNGALTPAARRRSGGSSSTSSGELRSAPLRLRLRPRAASEGEAAASAPAQTPTPQQLDDARRGARNVLNELRGLDFAGGDANRYLEHPATKAPPKHAGFPVPRVAAALRAVQQQGQEGSSSGGGGGEDLEALMVLNVSLFSDSTSRSPRGALLFFFKAVQLRHPQTHIITQPTNPPTHSTNQSPSDP